MIREMIESGFRYTIETTFPNESIRNFLMNHEKKDLFLKNMEKELSEVSNQFSVVRINSSDLLGIIKSMTLFFAKNALNAKEGEIMSSAEKARLMAQASFE